MKAVASRSVYINAPVPGGLRVKSHRPEPVAQLGVLEQYKTEYRGGDGDKKADMKSPRREEPGQDGGGNN